MVDVTPMMKVKDPCPCGHARCSKFGTPLAGKRGHVRGCPCPQCMGARNRKKGHAAQNVAQKALGVPRRKWGDTHEERWEDAYFANEVKAGAQVGPVKNWWRRVEAQVLHAEADFGDRRRSVRAVAMPDDFGGDGLVVVRLSTWQQHIGPALDEFYGTTR